MKRNISCLDHLSIHVRVAVKQVKIPIPPLTCPYFYGGIGGWGPSGGEDRVGGMMGGGRGERGQ